VTEVFLQTQQQKPLIKVPSAVQQTTTKQYLSRGHEQLQHRSCMHVCHLKPEQPSSTYTQILAVNVRSFCKMMRLGCGGLQQLALTGGACPGV
jgi:hypothetical protein